MPISGIFVQGFKKQEKDTAAAHGKKCIPPAYLSSAIGNVHTESGVIPQFTPPGKRQSLERVGGEAVYAPFSTSTCLNIKQLKR
jgi:hypothetical protein